MERLGLPHEAQLTLKRYHICFAELHHEEFSVGETYSVELGSETRVVRVIGAQDSPAGRKHHNRFAIFALEKVGQ
ncbi:MAG: hypothetical protein WCF77_02060 [Minisyncoccia bacterium]